MNPARLVKLIDKINEVKKTAARVPKPLVVQHPLDPNQKFQFPEGTDPQVANSLVRKMMILKARQGEQKIDLPSELPEARASQLDAEDKELDVLRAKVADLDARKNLKQMSPGIYLDDVTGKYYRVTGQGRIEAIAIGVE